jgi:hypothetical protein
MHASMCVYVCVHMHRVELGPLLHVACMEEDTCMSCVEEDTCVCTHAQSGTRTFAPQCCR